MARFSAINLTVRAGTVDLVCDASLSVAPGELVALIGPNGAGKSTLLKALMGLETPVSGGVMLDAQDFAAITPLERARTIAYLPQSRPLAWPLLVRDIVALGRFAYGAAPHTLSAEDEAAVIQALEAVDALPLANRRSDSLSGGEMARVHLARCFAAQTPLILADEPLAALDPLHQWQVMDLLKAYVARGNGALVVIHDLALAYRFADRLVWMQDGRIVAEGPPRDSMTPARLAQIYGIDAKISKDGISVSGLHKG